MVLFTSASHRPSGHAARRRAIAFVVSGLMLTLFPVCRRGCCSRHRQWVSSFVTPPLASPTSSPKRPPAPPLPLLAAIPPCRQSPNSRPVPIIGPGAAVAGSQTGATDGGCNFFFMLCRFRRLTLTVVRVCARLASPVMMRPELFSVSTPL